MKGQLVLENGEILSGNLQNYEKDCAGKLIFDTRVVGYEEVITNPAYSGKIVVFSYPMIGNYGINYEDSLSENVYPEGLIISELSKTYSNFRAKTSLQEFCRRKKLCILSGVDTQYITKKVRENTGLWAAIAPGSHKKQSLLSQIDSNKKEANNKDISSSISQPQTIENDSTQHIAILNLGITNTEISLLKTAGFSAEVYNPTEFSAQKVLKQACGVYVSSGYESLPTLKHAAKVLQPLVGKLPIFGTGAGHLVIGLCMNANIAPGFINHYGVNQPVIETSTKKLLITEQSHSLILEKNNSIKKYVRYINLNDNTIEGLKCAKTGIYSASFYSDVSQFTEFAGITGKKN